MQSIWQEKFIGIRPAQRIVLTTTNPLYRTSDGIDSFKVTSEDVLVIPFKL